MDHAISMRWLANPKQYMLIGGGQSLAKIVDNMQLKIESNMFIIDKFCKKQTYNIGGFIIMKHV
jgi:hypothetical protein